MDPAAPLHAQADGCPAAGEARPSARRHIDESPMVYRRLPDVLREHDGTVKGLHTLRPFAVAMAGPGEFDPYKD